MWLIGTNLNWSDWACGRRVDPGDPGRLDSTRSGGNTWAIPYLPAGIHCALSRCVRVPMFTTRANNSGRRIEIAPETRPDSIPGPKPPPLAPSSFMAIIRHCDEYRVQGTNTGYKDRINVVPPSRTNADPWAGNLHAEFRARLGPAGSGEPNPGPVDPPSPLCDWPNRFIRHSDE